MCYRETIRDKLIPQAVLWFTGEADQETYGDFDDENEDDEVHDIVLEDEKDVKDDDDDDEDEEWEEDEDGDNDESEKKVMDQIDCLPKI